MSTSSPVIWAMSAVSIDMLVIFVYFAIFFMILVAIAWPLAYFFRKVFSVFSVRTRYYD